ncbi:CLUMA_CG015513, isoform A [Clunio marinus]|uniref:CLUMA_CG015513, isoform A n=1 Tax=Clunio marinus TaxID=568069 RepID=A0A1J1IVH2_9DIPT|nr:CLUMA_CG015513, isoform A [Clunio marinus]
MTCFCFKWELSLGTTSVNELSYFTTSNHSKCFSFYNFVNNPWLQSMTSKLVLSQRIYYFTCVNVVRYDGMLPKTEANRHQFS